jgi:branched-subunit amino acid ABC-type transport system permease component
MTLPAIVLQLMSALVSATFLFLMAAGLSLIFGVCRILNLAHGSVFMLGAFLAYSVTRAFLPSLAVFWLVAVLVPLATAVLGGLVEKLLIRRFYGSDLLVQLMPMVALIYIISDFCRFVWGVSPRSVPVLGLFGTLEILDLTLPAYYLVVVLASFVIAAGLWIVIAKTRWGILVRAASQDREMSAACGVNQSRLFTTVYALASGLAGLAGVLAVPISGATLEMDMNTVVNAFVVVVVGGMGSVPGSMLAAILIGLVNAFGILVLPQFEMAFVYALMAMVLIIRPRGLFGRE